MYKILIADDNPLIRRGLNNMIEWKKLEACPAGFAENGEDALKKCEEERPDIVITDIRMPRKDGMELLTVLQQKYPRIQTIVVSAYDSFTYAKHAMVTGSLNYILKPIDSRELNETIQKAIEMLRKQEMGMDMVLKNALEELRAKTASRAGIYIMAGSGVSSERMKFSRRLFQDEIKVEEDNVSIVIGVLKEEFSEARLRQEYCNFIEEEALGIAKIPHEISDEELERYMNCAIENAYMQGFAWQPQQVVTEELRRPQQELLFLQIDSGNSRNACCILREGLKICERYETDLCRKNWEYIGQCLKMMSQYSMDGFDETSRIIQKFKDSKKQLFYKDIEEILNDMYRVVEKLCIQSSEQLHTQKDIALRIKRIIEEHYQDDMSAERMSELFDYSAVYLNKLFKKEIGTSIGQYLIGVRMENAENLLRETDMKIIDIAHQVGYADELHFQKLFKKKTGKTPGNYRKERV